MPHPLSLTINGEPYTLLVEPYCSLLDMLRDQLQLTGTKKGCDEGDCGACTVLMNGKTVTSCMVLALDARGKDSLVARRIRSSQEATEDHGHAVGQGDTSQDPASQHPASQNNASQDKDEDAVPSLTWAQQRSAAR